MLKKEIINFENDFVHSSAELNSTPQEQVLNKIVSLMVCEFNYWGKNLLSKEVYKIDLKPYLNMKKQQALTHIRNELQNRMPAYTWNILKCAEHVEWELANIYTWFE